MKMVNSSKFYQIVDWYEDEWRKDRKVDLSDEIRSKILSEVDDDRVFALRHVLRFEFMRHGRYVDALRVLEEEIQASPENSQPRIETAEHLLYFLELPKQALARINEAILVAKVSGEFIRNALQVKARILRRIEDYDELAICMKEIMKIKKVHPQLDAAKESDFLDQLPENAIAKELLIDFHNYLSLDRK
jgi:plasmid stabilization system protein ParE